MSTRRGFLAAMAALSASLSAQMPGVGAALAQGAAAPGAYPERPIRFHAGFPPGGVADTVARIIGPAMAERLGQPVVIDNRAGAGGVVGVDAVARAAPDGYTMGFGVSGALTSSVTLMPKLPYDPTRDIAPISLVVLNPLVLVVPASSGIENLQDFMRAARARRGRTTYGTAGAGTAMHLSGELLEKMAGIELTHIPYKGSAPAAVDLLGGHLDAAVLDLATAKPHLAPGRLRAIGLTSARRTELAPEIPTIAEAGVPGYEFNAWFGLVMPAATPAAIVERVHAELVAVLKDPAVRRKLLEAGAEPMPGTPSSMRAQIAREIEVTADLIRSANIRID